MVPQDGGTIGNISPSKLNEDSYFCAFFIRSRARIDAVYFRFSKQPRATELTSAVIHRCCKVAIPPVDQQTITSLPSNPLRQDVGDGGCDVTRGSFIASNRAEKYYDIWNWTLEQYTTEYPHASATFFFYTQALRNDQGFAVRTTLPLSNYHSPSRATSPPRDMGASSSSQTPLPAFDEFPIGLLEVHVSLQSRLIIGQYGSIHHGTSLLM